MNIANPSRPGAIFDVFNEAQNDMLPSEVLKSKREEILALARNAGALGVRVFGSVARGEDSPTSDLDLLISPGPRMSLLEFAGLRIDIERALGIRVDLVSEGGLHPLLRTKVLAEARPL